jgi:hypothetical protein
VVDDDHWGGRETVGLGYRCEFVDEDVFHPLGELQKVNPKK